MASSIVSKLLGWLDYQWPIFRPQRTLSFWVNETFLDIYQQNPMSNNLTKKESVPIFQKFKKSRFFKKVERVIWGVLLLGCLEVASSGPLFTLFTPAYFQLYCVPKPQAWFKLQCFLQACRITLTASSRCL